MAYSNKELSNKICKEYLAGELIVKPEEPEILIL